MVPAHANIVNELNNERNHEPLTQPVQEGRLFVIVWKAISNTPSRQKNN